MGGMAANPFGKGTSTNTLGGDKNYTRENSSSNLRGASTKFGFGQKSGTSNTPSNAWDRTSTTKQSVTRSNNNPFSGGQKPSFSRSSTTNQASTSRPGGSSWTVNIGGGGDNGNREDNSRSYTRFRPDEPQAMNSFNTYTPKINVEEVGTIDHDPKWTSELVKEEENGSNSKMRLTALTYK